MLYVLKHSKIEFAKQIYH